MIFVFGSNLAGIHGAGAAREAFKYHGAQWGVGEGLAGNSYALPTKNERIKDMPLSEVKKHIDTFIECARNHPELDFKVTCVGTGLAIHKSQDIAPLFRGAPRNCHFDKAWCPWLGEDVSYWGTFP